MKKTELGAWGENLAAAQLEKEGYRIRERNFRCRLGEIDIIAQKGDILAFVEVKLRKSSSHGEAREFVTASKQQKLRMTASFFLTCWKSTHRRDRRARPAASTLQTHSNESGKTGARLQVSAVARKWRRCLARRLLSRAYQLG